MKALRESTAPQAVCFATCGAEFLIQKMKTTDDADDTDYLKTTALLLGFNPRHPRNPWFKNQGGTRTFVPAIILSATAQVRDRPRARGLESRRGPTARLRWLR